MNTSRRKLRSITLDTKLKVLRTAKENNHKSYLTRNFDLPRSTIQSLLRAKSKILQAIKSGSNPFLILLFLCLSFIVEDRADKNARRRFGRNTRCRILKKASTVAIN
uniref:HTH psq-type domain-containing protein n=1 Tax=Acrobeloides nanus TaxID=290746 RepID=A0A914DFM2_9BILA